MNIIPHIDEPPFARPQLRILVDCAPLSGGGGSQVACAFLENLVKADIADWRAVATKPTISLLSPALQNDARIMCVKKQNWFDLLRIGRLLAREERGFLPDIVFSVFGPTYFTPHAFHLVGFALPLMIYDVEPPLQQPSVSARFKEWLGKRAFRKADHIVVETETVKVRMIDRLDIEGRKISVIGNSVNPLFVAEPAPHANSTGGMFSILVPAAHYPHKNLEIIPKVAAALAKSTPDFQFEFLLTLDPDLPAWRAIAQDATRLGVGHHVKTLGNLTLVTLATHYQNSSVIFLPTIREASTAVYPESFQAKRPLVTSDYDFARDLCGDAALYVPPADPVAIAETLLQLSNNKALAADLVVRGEVRLRDYYPTAAEKFSQQMALIRSLVAADIGSRGKD